MWMSARWERTILKPFHHKHEGKTRKGNGNGKKMFLVMSRNNYVLMYEWDQQVFSPSNHFPKEWNRKGLVGFLFASSHSKAAKVRIIKHFANENFWWIWKRRAGRVKSVDWKWESGETLGLFLFCSVKRFSFLKNRWENYLIATNVNNNLDYPH